MKATIEVEFETNPGQPENVARAALARGLGDLRLAIERGHGGGPTGVKSGSVQAMIIRREIID